MVKQFLDVVHNVFVRKHGVRVIMTSHLPSTVALAPEESLFEMHRVAPRIRKVTRQEAISSLTSGLIVVRGGTRCVIVEDNDDAEFYTATIEQLRSMEQFSPEIPLVFLSAGRKRGDQTTGGRKEVEKWVPRLRAEAGMSEIVGIVDEDNDESEVPGVIRLDRYSHENYILDPLVTYACLHAANRAPFIDGINLGFGDERVMNRLSRDELEKIAESVVKQVVPHLEELDQLDKERVDVEYVNDARCSVPHWLFSRRGKDLLRAYQKAFGQPVVNPKTLREAFLRTRFIPTELRDVFSRLQSL